MTATAAPRLGIRTFVDVRLPTRGLLLRARMFPEPVTSETSLLWGNYAELGYRRLIYTNTVSVLAEATGMFERVMMPDVRLVRVLLTATDATASERLAGPELGSELEKEVERSAYKARLLDEEAPADILRVVTDGRSVVDIARQVVAATGWIKSGPVREIRRARGWASFTVMGCRTSSPRDFSTAPQRCGHAGTICPRRSVGSSRGAWAA